LALRRQAPHGQFPEDFFLGVAGAADDFFKRGDELLLIVDQAAEGGKFAVAGEFADIPRVLGKQVERALLRRADEVFAVERLGFRQAVEAARAEAGVAAVEQGADLEEDAVALS